MNKKIIIPGVLVVVVAAIIFTTFTLLWQKKNENYFRLQLSVRSAANYLSALNNTSGQLNSCKADIGQLIVEKADAEAERDKYRDSFLEDVFFNSDIKKGDKIGGWKVLSVKKFDEAGSGVASDTSTFFPDNAAVSFSGSVTISGMSDCINASTTARGTVECSVFCLNDLDAASEAKIPHYKDDNKEAEICFSDADLMNVGIQKSRDPRQYQLVIGDLVLNYSEADGVYHQAKILKYIEDGASITGTIFNRAKIGDKVSGMTIETMSYADYDKQVSFTGQATVTGDFYQTAMDGIELTCFRNFDAASEAKLPKMYDGVKSEFCFDNDQAVVKNKLLAQATAGRATIAIDNLSLIDCNCGAYPGADLISVINVNKK
jgi:hypothetical protein